MAKRDMPRGVYPTRQENVKVVPEKVVEPLEEVELQKVVAANCNFLNVRERPTCDAKILFEIPAGTVLEVGEMADEWIHVHVKLEDGRQDGYVMRKFTKGA